MIAVLFVPPCFECEIEDLDGNVLTELHSAADEQALRGTLDERVQGQLIAAVRSVKPYDFEKRWRARARLATERAIAAQSKPPEPPEPGEEPPKPFEFESHIWAELKGYLRRLFHEKCAYCEARFSHAYFGDVEHYRPKKKVDGERAHPGYFWLAYDEHNLLPSCALCNQARGKMNQFPIAGVRASSPTDDLEAEQALLLNPYRDDPALHLHFMPKIGMVAARASEGTPSPKGDASRRAYNLNREMLVEVRRKEQKNVRQTVSLALSREQDDAYEQALEDCRIGRQPFASASLAEIEDYLNYLDRMRQRLSSTISRSLGTPSSATQTAGD
jgi:uncharacterized protein (TIGR02646 family)